MNQVNNIQQKPVREARERIMHALELETSLEILEGARGKVIKWSKLLSDEIYKKTIKERKNVFETERLYNFKLKEVVNNKINQESLKNDTALLNYIIKRLASLYESRLIKEELEEISDVSTNLIEKNNRTVIKYVPKLSDHGISEEVISQIYNDLKIETKKVLKTKLTYRSSIIDLLLSI